MAPIVVNSNPINFINTHSLQHCKMRIVKVKRIIYIYTRRPDRSRYVRSSRGYTT